MDNTDYRDFLGKELKVGDYVIYTQKNKYGNKPLAYGIVEELGGISQFEDIEKTETVITNGMIHKQQYAYKQQDVREFPCSVVVRRIKSRGTRGKYKDKFPADAKYLIKVLPGDIMLKLLADGNSDFLKTC